MNVAVFYHCWLPTPWAEEVFFEQMSALRHSGLEERADEIHIGFNGTALDSCVVSGVMPKANVVAHGGNVGGEYQTIRMIERWLPGKKDWAVCYHHIKGASNPSDLVMRWRRCMERSVIWNWPNCVGDLETGFETVGNHWYRFMDQQYWAGTFWWARSEYLQLLPPIPDTVVNGHSYEAEVWIGKCGRRPRKRDYANHKFMKCP